MNEDLHRRLNREPADSQKDIPGGAGGLESLRAQFAFLAQKPEAARSGAENADHAPGAKTEALG